MAFIQPAFFYRTETLFHMDVEMSAMVLFMPNIILKVVFVLKTKQIIQNCSTILTKVHQHQKYNKKTLTKTSTNKVSVVKMPFTRQL